MRELNLLDRVRNWEKKTERHFGMDEGRLVDSIVSHLQNLLNAKQGTTLMDDAFGMPDFTDLAVTFPDSVKDIEILITETIERYEPRLKEVDVDFAFQDDQTLVIFFQITATLDSGEDNRRVYLESAINPKGKMTIKG